MTNPTLATLSLLIRSLSQRLAPARDERGAIPAEVAWIAGIVVLALAVIVILTAITTGAANSINLK